MSVSSKDNKGLGRSGADAPSLSQPSASACSASAPQSSQSGIANAAGPWIAAADALPTEKGQPLLVTNNPNARNAFGHLSHAWCVNGIYEGSDGEFCAFDSNLKIWGVSHWAPIFPPASAAGAGTAETAQQAQGGARQSGPKGDAQTEGA